ncbi:MAG: hypothetical protein PHH58_16405 [Rhodoferax sp.]|nr:hypothetical protein [Rhodoferax sp.]
MTREVVIVTVVKIVQNVLALVMIVGNGRVSVGFAHVISPELKQMHLMR